MGAIQSTCIHKYRDNKGIITGYRLRDRTGAEVDIAANKLKKAVMSKQIEVDNLTLTSDNRLVSTTTKDGMDISSIRNTIKSYIEARQYQSILDSVGIDLLGIVKLDISNNTTSAQEMYERAIKKCTTVSEEHKMRNNLYNMQAVLQNPNLLMGVVAIGNALAYDAYKDRISNKTFKNNDNRVASAYMLLIHKNGQYKICGISEYTRLYKAGPTIIIKDTVDRIKKSNNFSYDDKTLIAIESNLDTKVLHLGTHISNNEKVKAARLITNSNFEYWLANNATKKLLAKVGKEDAVACLRAVGINTLGYAISLPILACALIEVTCDGVTDACSKEVDRVNNLSTEKKLGYIGGPVRGRINEIMTDVIDNRKSG